MTTRDRAMVLVLALAGLVAAGWFLVLAPMRSESRELATQLDTQRALLEQALAEASAGAQARRDYARHYAAVARLGAAVPEDDHVPSLLVQVERAAKAARVEFRELRLAQGGGAAAPAASAPAGEGASTSHATTATLPPGAAVGDAGFPTMPFAFEFDGRFFDLAGFIGRLEDFLAVRKRSLAVAGRLMAIDGIGLRAAAAGFPEITASIAATAYLVPPGQGLTAGATPAGPAPVDDDTGAAPAASSSGGVAPSTATATPVRP